jgi:gamma-glutamylcyclotransferase (GGCT)/AIG2-like uncharacterized protein YtfP
MTSKPAPILYFAYGPDLSKKQMKERAPESVPKLSATLPHFGLVFMGWSRQWKGGTANIRAARGQKVAGGVYEITDKDLRRLDNFEGYPGQANRINVTVFTEAGEALKVITYIKTTQAEEAKPSAEYVAVIKQGYVDWGIV